MQTQPPFSFPRAVCTLALAMATVAMLEPSPAQACKCMQLTPAQAYEQAVAVFEGHVTEVREPTPEQARPANPRRVRMQAVRSWKGLESETVEVTTASDSAACGFAFTKDESYLVYASAVEGHLHVTSCSRTRSMSDAGEDLQAMGMGATPVDPTEAAVPAPTPAASPAPAPTAPVTRGAPTRGGCASCAIGPGNPGSPAALLAWLIGPAWLAWRRARRNRAAKATQLPD